MKKDDEIKVLVKDIDKLQQSNDEKEENLSYLKAEIELISRKLVDIREENEHLREKEKVKSEEAKSCGKELSEDAKPLGEELGIFKPNSLIVESCDPCNFASKNETILKRHKELKLRELELETTIFKQKLTLSSKSFKLEKKNKRKRSFVIAKAFVISLTRNTIGRSPSSKNYNQTLDIF